MRKNSQKSKQKSTKNAPNHSNPIQDKNITTGNVDKSTPAIDPQEPNSTTNDVKTGMIEKGISNMKKSDTPDTSADTTTETIPSSKITATTSTTLKRLDEEESRLLWKLELLERGTVTLTSKDHEIIKENAKYHHQDKLEKIKSVQSEEDAPYTAREQVMLEIITSLGLENLTNLRKCFHWEEKYNRSIRLRDHSHSLATDAMGKVELLLDATTSLEARAKEDIKKERERFDVIISDIQDQMKVFSEMESKLTKDNTELREKLLATLEEEHKKGEQLRSLRQKNALDKRISEKDLRTKTVLCEEQARMLELSNRQITQLTELKDLYEKNLDEYKRRNDTLQKAVIENKKNNQKYASSLNKMKTDVDDVIRINKELKQELETQRSISERRRGDNVDLEQKIAEMTLKIANFEKKDGATNVSNGSTSTKEYEKKEEIKS